jgi:hypothetical protein
MFLFITLHLLFSKCAVHNCFLLLDLHFFLFEPEGDGIQSICISFIVDNFGMQFFTQLLMYLTFQSVNTFNISSELIHVL